MNEHYGDTQGQEQASRQTHSHPPKKTHYSLSLVPGVLIKGTDLLCRTPVEIKKMGGKSRINLHPHLSPAPPGKSGGGGV